MGIRSIVRNPFPPHPAKEVPPAAIGYTLDTPFVSLIAHELRSPLSTIRGAVAPLGDHGERLTPERRTELLAIVDDSTPQIDRVVQDVMVALERRRARNRARGYRYHQDHPRCRERACARTSVFNEGHGIPPSEQARQFTPFATLSKRTSESMGLGLFIAKGLVETMSGAIGFSTQPVENALFWFTLPIGRSAGSTPTLEEKRAHTIH